MSIGNGTASRETDKLAIEVIKVVAERKPEQKVAKNCGEEAGASGLFGVRSSRPRNFPRSMSVYVAPCPSPEDCRDPAELEDRSQTIGVGQYQHDVISGRSRGRFRMRRSKTASTRSGDVGIPRRPVSRREYPLLNRVPGAEHRRVSIRTVRSQSHDDSQGSALGREDFEQAAGFFADQ